MPRLVDVLHHLVDVQCHDGLLVDIQRREGPLVLCPLLELVHPLDQYSPPVGVIHLVI